MSDEAVDPLTYYKSALIGYDQENRNLKAALKEAERERDIYRGKLDAVTTRLNLIKKTDYRLRSSQIRNLLSDIKT